MDDIIRTMRISGSGMRVQGQRLRVIAQNIANANSLPQEPNENPYRRKVMTFKNEFETLIICEFSTKGGSHYWYPHTPVPF